MNFGEALTALKNGDKVFRVGWNGKGMWLALQVPDEHSKMRRPYIYMRPVYGDLVPWVASQTDILAEDWLIRVVSDKQPDDVEPLAEPTPVTPTATTAAQDAGITLTVHLDGKVLYDAIRPHAERARQLDRLRSGYWPLT